MQFNASFNVLRKPTAMVAVGVGALMIAGCMQVGKIAAKLMTQKTSDLSGAAIQVRFIRNLYPSETRTTEVTYDPAMWKPGSNIVMVNLQKRQGIGMYQVDGKVFIGDKEVPHVANGVYALALDKDDLSPKRIRIETSSGQKAEFEAGPAAPIRILSVNGKKEGIEVDMTKDLQIELENPPGSEGTEFKFGLLADIMGTRTFPEIGVFKAADKVTIPASVWTNPGSGFVPNMGDSYMLVERFGVAQATNTAAGAAQVISQSWDCVPVKVTGEVDKSFFGTASNTGIEVKDEIKNERGRLGIHASKPTAFLGRPFSSGKKFAIASFSLRATRLKQSKSSSSTSTAGNLTTTTTTTTTRTFPTLPDAFWESLVNDLYADFTETLKANHDIELVPVEQVLAAPSYKALEPIPDEVTEVQVEKSWGGTKNLIPTSFTAMVKNISSTFASDRLDARLVRELGVDGIISVTIDLSMPWEEFSLSPRLAYRITGAPNGYTMGPTVYAQGVIEGDGVPLDEAKMDAQHVMEVLPKVIRREDLKAAVDLSLKKLSALEKEKGYEALWALK